MTEIEARKSLHRWRRWAEQVERRWAAGTPMYDLARRRVLEAELRLLEIQAATQYR